MSRYSDSCIKQTITEKPANSWDEHLENLVSIQHLNWIKNTFSLKNIIKTTSNKQTRSFYVRKKIKVLFLTCFHYVSHLDALESSYCRYYTERFIVNVSMFSTSCTVLSVLTRLAMYGFDRS